MKYQNKKIFLKNQKKGMALLPLIIVLSLVIIAIGSAMMTSGFIESLTTKSEIESKKSFFYSDSGVEDALLKTARNKDFTGTWSLPVPSGASSSVSTTSTKPGYRNIESSADVFQKKRKIQTDVEINENTGKIESINWQELPY